MGQHVVSLPLSISNRSATDMATALGFGQHLTALRRRKRCTLLPRALLLILAGLAQPPEPVDEIADSVSIRWPQSGFPRWHWLTSHLLPPFDGCVRKPGGYAA